MVPKACRVIPKFHGEGIGRLVFYRHPRPLPYASGCPNVTQFFLGTKKARGFRVFKRQRAYPCWLGLSRSLAFPKSKGFSGKIYTKYELGQKYHRKCIVKPFCERSSLWGKPHRLGSALHGAKIFSSMGIFCSIFRSYYTSDYLATWGKCIVFLTTSLGCYSLRRSCNLSRGR